MENLSTSASGPRAGAGDITCRIIGCLPGARRTPRRILAVVGPVSVETAARCYLGLARTGEGAGDRDRTLPPVPLSGPGTADDQLRILGSRRPAAPNLSARSPHNNLIGRCIVVLRFFGTISGSRHAIPDSSATRPRNYATLFHPGARLAPRDPSPPNRFPVTN